MNGSMYVQHEGPVYAMARDGPGLVTGGKDGFIVSWDSLLKKVATFSILDVSPQPLSSAIHSVCVDPLRMKWLVATKSGDVYEVVKDTGASMLLNEVSRHGHKVHHQITTSSSILAIRNMLTDFADCVSSDE